MDSPEIDEQAFLDRLWAVRPYGTWALLGACAFVFLLEWLLGGTTQGMVLLRLGANYVPLVLHGQWWRLVGASFVHIGPQHWATNSILLFIVGERMEQYYGTQRYLALYSLSAVGGSLLSCCFGPGMSAGASGAIFGLFGAALTVGYRYRKHMPLPHQKRLRMVMTGLIGFSLLWQITESGVDNYCHLGGLLTGALFAGTVSPRMFGPAGPSMAMQTITAAFAGIELVTLMLAIPASALPVQPTTEYRSKDFSLQAPSYVRQGPKPSQYEMLGADITFTVQPLRQDISVASERLLADLKKPEGASTASVVMRGGVRWTDFTIPGDGHYPWQPKTAGPLHRVSLAHLQEQLVRVDVTGKDSSMTPSALIAADDMMQSLRMHPPAVP